MKYELYPPLGLISSDLFGQETPAEENAPAEQMSPASDKLDLEMPAFLSELVQRRVASQATYPPAPPAVGHIRRFACIPEANRPGRLLGRSYGVLLGACLGGHYWSGWIVAQEADYATDRDLLLQEEDGPIAPEAAMIQAWNPVRVQVRGDEVVLGKLSPHRLAAVLHLADEAADRGSFVAPRPGRIGAWNLDHQTAVVTGTPLGDDTDPRHSYQQLYRNLATEISAAAVRQTEAQPEVTRPSLIGWMNRTFVRPVWTYAALTVLLSQGLWLLASSGLSPEYEGVYRSAGHVQRPGACEPRVRIIFKPDTPYADVAVILRRVGATLADGPSETGEVWITLPTDQSTQEATSTLKLSQLVEAADVVAPEKGSCSK
jgi:hypothetical protein